MRDPAHLFDGYSDEVLDRFWNFHQTNPHIYEEFKRKAHGIRARGRERYGARTITESMRWDFDMRTVGDVFELNDNFVPIYVRLLIYDEPEFEGFFELRAVRSRGIKSDEQRRREGEAGLDDEYA